MKKVFLTLGCVALFGLSSCKKDWTCECTTTDGNGNEIGTTSISISDQKEGDAEDACEGNEVSAGGATTSCTLEEA